jgi:predicted nucleic acid-binding protein
MTPTEGSAVFVDTNVLIYASFPGTPFHYAARASLASLESNGVTFWISRQVIREFLASTTRPGNISPQPTLAAIAQSVRHFETEFRIADEDTSVTGLLIDLVESHAVQGK